MVSKAEIKRVQKLIDSGLAWKLEGSVGRYCMDMITAGYCMLGKEAHQDYWGNKVPSRYDVKAGTKGSAEYVADAKKRREDEGMPEFE